MILALALGVRAALIANGTITAAVGTSPARVYLKRAPEDAALPYIVMDDVGGGSTNDTPLDSFDMLWQVKVVGSDATAALALSDTIRGVLHNGTISLESPWKLIDIQAEEPFYYVEDADRRQYQHAGATYRVRGSK